MDWAVLVSIDNTNNTLSSDNVAFLVGDVHFR
jgi:hypothetical protein